jgi:hypothetical protein
LGSSRKDENGLRIDPRQETAGGFSWIELPFSGLGLGDNIRVIRENIIYSGNLFM